MDQAAHQASAGRRERLVETILARGSPLASADTNESSSSLYALDQLVLEPPDGWLADKQLVARKLLGSAAEPARPPDDDASNSRQQYFTLGARLEADAVLDWFAREHQSPAPTQDQREYPPSTGWPLEACRLCSAAHLEPATGGGSPSASTDCADQPATGSTKWIRPLVLSLHVACMLITFGLVGVLFRVRKSRVSICAMPPAALYYLATIWRPKLTGARAPVPDHHRLRLANVGDNAYWRADAIRKRKCWPRTPLARCLRAMAAHLCHHYYITTHTVVGPRALPPPRCLSVTSSPQASPAF